jgi:uroporphyrinogen-III synthase
MRVLVTRPAEDARSLVAALESRGHEAIIEPMLTIAPVSENGAPNLAGVQALLFTSANGVRAFAGRTAARGFPVFTVGEGSAAAARAAGFAQVESAGGDVEDLARLVAARLEPKGGALFHAAGSKLAGDLKGALEGAGFTYRRDVLYRAETADALSDGLRAMLADGEIDAATFFSPRTAVTFVSLIQDTGLAGACARIIALALSRAVAEKLGDLAWAGVAVAARPEQDSLLACLDSIAAGTSPAVTD